MSDLSIVFLTYKRTEYALRTIAGVQEYLRFDGRIQWVVADDMSEAAHVGEVISELPSDTKLDMRKLGYGGKANWAWLASDSDVTLWLEDDWELRRPFDITPYVSLLRERKDVGVIRLGHLPVGLHLQSCGHDGRMYLECLKASQYAFSGNPHLKHKRLQTIMYPTDKNPGDTEIAYDYKLRTGTDLKILWPLAIGDTFPFAHIGEERSY